MREPRGETGAEDLDRPCRPELAQVQVRELPEKTDVFGRAAVAGWGSVDVLTNSVFREPCTFYFSREALRAVDAAFVLDLVTVIRGQDKKGHDFEMTALLAGRGKLVVLYDRDGIIYRNERLARDFRLASRVEFETPAAGGTRKCPGAVRQSSTGGLRARPIPREGRRDARGSCGDLHLGDAAEADPDPGPRRRAPDWLQGRHPPGSRACHQCRPSGSELFFQRWRSFSRIPKFTMTLTVPVIEPAREDATNAMRSATSRDVGHVSVCVSGNRACRRDDCRTSVVQHIDNGRPETLDAGGDECAPTGQFEIEAHGAISSRAILSPSTVKRIGDRRGSWGSLPSRGRSPWSGPLRCGRRAGRPCSGTSQTPRPSIARSPYGRGTPVVRR